MINQPELMLRKSAPGRSSGYEKDIDLSLVIFLRKMLLNTKYFKLAPSDFFPKKSLPSMMLPVLLLFGLNSTFWLIWRQYKPTTVHSETGWITWRFLVLNQKEFGADIFCMFMTDGTYIFHLELLISLIWVSANFQNYHDCGFF